MSKKIDRNPDHIKAVVYGCAIALSDVSNNILRLWIIPRI